VPDAKRRQARQDGPPKPPKSDKTLKVEEILARVTRERHRYIPPRAMLEIKLFESAKRYLRSELLGMSLTEINAYDESDWMIKVLRYMTDKSKMDMQALEKGTHGIEKGPAGKPA
jgi:hypothetical protein